MTVSSTITVMSFLIVHYVAMETSNSSIIDQHDLATTDETSEHASNITIPTADVNKANNALEAAADNFAKVLIDIQSENCHHFSLCFTDERPLDRGSFTHSVFQESCCHPCICDVTCYKNRTCCLDFRATVNISDSEANPNDINSSKFTNKSSTKIDEGPSDSVNSSFPVYKEIKKRNECVRQHISMTNESPTFYDGKAFLMVASCMPSGKGSHLHTRCEEQGHIHIPLRLPVTSSLSNISYANEYCLYCNEESVTDDDYVPWKPYLLCQPSKLTEIPAVRTVVDLYNVAVNMRKDGDCYMVFMPPNEIMTSLTECIHYDITSCNVTGAWLVHNETLRSACMSDAVSPVRARVLSYESGRELTFKNIACYMCNDGNSSRLLQQCSRERYIAPSTSVELLSKFSLPKNIPGSKGLSTLLPEGMDNSGKCAKESFYDIYTNQCRQLHCPKDFINVQNMCMPVYGMLNRTHIHVGLRMRYLEETLLSQAIKDRRNISNAFMKFMTNQNFSSCHSASSAWVKVTNQNKVQYVLFEIVFHYNTRKISFHKVLSQLDVALKTTESFGAIYHKEGIRLAYEVILDDIVVLSKTSPVTYVDLKDGKELVPFTKFRALPPRFCGMMVRIGTTSYCASVHLSPEEFSVKNGILNVQDQYLYGREFEARSDGSAFICVDSYNRRGSRSTVNNRERGTDESHRAAEANRVFMIVCLAIGGTIIVVFISERIYKKFLKPRLGSGSTLFALGRQ